MTCALPEISNFFYNSIPQFKTPPELVLVEPGGVLQLEEGLDSAEADGADHLREVWRADGEVEGEN